MGCVGGRVVCVCELINLRCVFVGMCMRGWGRGQAVWCLGVGCGGAGGKRKQGNRGEKSSHPQKSGVVFSMK